MNSIKLNWICMCGYANNDVSCKKCERKRSVVMHNQGLCIKCGIRINKKPVPMWCESCTDINHNYTHTQRLSQEA